MNDVLYQYLKNEWRDKNLPKYQKYFEVWICNLTEIQIFYYNKLWLK